MLPVRVVPAVGPAAPAAGQVWMGDVDAGVHVRDDDPLAAVSEIPQRRRVDQGHVRLGGRRRGRGRGLRGRHHEIGTDLAHVLVGRELADNGGRGRNGDGIDDPQRLDIRDQALRPAELEQRPQRRWARSAWARRIRAAAPGRFFRASPLTPARSACDLSTTIALTISSWPAASGCSCGATAAAWSAATRGVAARPAAVPDASSVVSSVRTRSRLTRFIGRPPGSSPPVRASPGRAVGGGVVAPRCAAR